MTKTEDNAWFLIAGLLIGMELEFLFMPDIDFFREKWPIVLVALIVWAIVRRGSNDKCREHQGNDGARNGKLD